MKPKLNIIRDYAMIVTFCGAIVTGMWNLRETKAQGKSQADFQVKMEKWMEGIDTFRLEQVGINAADEAIYGIVVEIILDE